VRCLGGFLGGVRVDHRLVGICHHDVPIHDLPPS
jgi:hypothetical protein